MSPRMKEMAELAAHFDAQASNEDQAQTTLMHLAAGLFGSDGVGIDRLTWPDERTSAARKEDSTEARLRAAEARFRTLIEQIPAVTFMAVLGEGKNEMYVSPHVEQMLGFTQEEWLADPFLWYMQLHPEDRALWNDKFAEGCRTGGPFRAECRFLARDGHVVWVHGEARLVKDDLGRPMFLQGVAFDITESKRAQEVLVKEAVRTAKQEEELLIAQRVQTSILPRDLAVEGLEIAAAMIPASEVGGDYYEVLPFPGGAWLAIGDVAGHGLDAGLIMLMLQSAVASIVRARPEASPREVLVSVNEVLFDNIRNRLRHDEHITFTIMRYTKDGRIVMAGAHEDVVVCRKRTGKAELIRPPGPWLGAVREVGRTAVDTMFQLEKGDLFVLYTDGVTEAMNGEHRQYDIERLCSAIEEAQNETALRVRDHVLDGVRAWMKEQVDDISLVAIRYHGTTA